jgi:putative pyruvate formate lyase activating enzyme
MHRQVGDLVVENGIAVRGMLIRHLVLPGNLADSGTVMRFIAEEISRDSYVNIMAQYRWPASESPPELIKKNPNYRDLLRPITAEEYLYTIRYAKEVGLHRGFKEKKLP